MAQPAAIARTKTVETKTTEEIPVENNESMGLGMPWQEYLAGIPDDELAITDVKVYRREPRTQDGFLVKVRERVDDVWIQERFGGGVFDVTIRSKSGKSHYERGIKIAGTPKFLPSETAPASNPAAAGATDATLARLTDLLANVIDRLDTARTAPAAAGNGTTDSVVKIMSEAASKAVEIAGQGAAGRHEPDALDKQLREVLLKKLLEPPQVPTFKEKLEEMKLLKEIVAPPAAAGGLLGELEKLGKIRELLGWGGEGAIDWKGELVRQGPAFLEGLAKITEDRRETAASDLERARLAAAMRRGGAPAVGPAMSAGGGSAPAVVQTSAPGTGLRMVPLDQGGAPPPAPASDAAMPGFNSESPEFVAFIKGRIVELIDSGMEGEGLVDWLEGNRQQRFLQMLQQMSPEQITSYLTTDPILRAAVEHPRWQEVLEQAREYLQPPEPERGRGRKPQPVQ